MRNSDSLRKMSGPDLGRLRIGAVRIPRRFMLGLILIFALLAFEAFNFDTTRFALQNLMGDIRFAGIAWATILAIAFCAIDFAGLGRLLTPERGRNEPKEIWYLTGAWLLGATMNAVMTWWAVSTVLLSHELGNEILSRDQLLHIVPVFVAILVWLTRILFIGAITMAGERLLHGDDVPPQEYLSSSGASTSRAGQSRPAYATRSSTTTISRGSASMKTAPADSASHAGRRTTRLSKRPPGPRAGSRHMASNRPMRAAQRNRR